MSRSLTLRVPTARTALTAIVVVLVAVVLIVAGVRIGWSLVSGGPIGELARGAALQEVHLANGTVYVGQLTAEDGGYLKLTDPAVLRQQASSEGASASASQLIVQALFTDPYDSTGPVLIPRDQVTLVANVTSGSGLANAYDQALHGGTQPQPTPTPVTPSSPSTEPSSSSPSP